jgi:hypothetical protein
MFARSDYADFLRKYFLTAAAVGFLAAAPRARAAEDGPVADAPIKRIVLFSSGVGYFEHQGQVEGNATIDLKFDVEDVNDLLKSMVLEDRGRFPPSPTARATPSPRRSAPSRSI